MLDVQPHGNWKVKLEQLGGEEMLFTAAVPRYDSGAGHRRWLLRITWRPVATVITQVVAQRAGQINDRR
ncbi:MAG TPA: hypothetical protein VE645_15925 [Pseudonocardiaceae bacterium]|nr:hypothetical protein [Pseudonocardiaceae bacterium]